MTEKSVQLLFFKENFNNIVLRLTGNNVPSL